MPAEACVLKKQWFIKIDKKVFVSALTQKAPLRCFLCFYQLIKQAQLLILSRIFIKIGEYLIRLAHYAVGLTLPFEHAP